jgi:hypothetical protein
MIQIENPQQPYNIFLVNLDWISWISCQILKYQI